MEDTYVPKAAFLYKSEWGVSMTADTVFEERGPIDTGLLDKEGRPLFRVPETVPIGFQPPRSKS